MKKKILAFFGLCGCMALLGTTTSNVYAEETTTPSETTTIVETSTETTLVVEEEANPISVYKTMVGTKEYTFTLNSETMVAVIDIKDLKTNNTISYIGIYEKNSNKFSIYLDNELFKEFTISEDTLKFIDSVASAITGNEEENFFEDKVLPLIITSFGFLLALGIALLVVGNKFKDNGLKVKNLSDETNDLKEALKKFEEAFERITGTENVLSKLIESLDKNTNETDKIKKAFKLIASNDPNLVGKGIAKEVVEELSDNAGTKEE